MKDRFPNAIEQQLDELVRRYARADNGLVALLNRVGGSGETLLAKLPEGAKVQIADVTHKALQQAALAAQNTQSMWAGSATADRLAASALGAVGGAWGLPTAIAELPLTVTWLMRVIQTEARAHGFDPSNDNVQFDCVQVFAAAGPAVSDDGVDIGFLSARLTITGSTMAALIARVAPRLSVVLGQKLAAQTVPVLGAVTGASMNYLYSGYYREMAYVHFSLRRMAIDSGVAEKDLRQALLQRLAEGAVVQN